jgi:hypothetical protein
MTLLDLGPDQLQMGTQFHPAARPQPDSAIHWDNW